MEENKNKQLIHFDFLVDNLSVEKANQLMDVITLIVGSHNIVGAFDTMDSEDLRKESEESNKKQEIDTNKKDWELNLVIEKIDENQADDVMNMIIQWAENNNTFCGGGFIPLKEDEQKES
jgi:hypothetical protein